MSGRRDTRDFEIEELLREPSVRRRWPDGLTTDDVLDDLHALGRLHVRVRDVVGVDGRRARFACAVELRGGAGGMAVGRGGSLTAAALRCLLAAEDELGEEVRRGLQAFDDLLDAA